MNNVQNYFQTIDGVEIFKNENSERILNIYLYRHNFREINFSI